MLNEFEDLFAEEDKIDKFSKDFWKACSREDFTGMCIAFSNMKLTVELRIEKGDNSYPTLDEIVDIGLIKKKNGLFSGQMAKYVTAIDEVQKNKRSVGYGRS